VENFRLRIIPVLGTQPSILGLTLASYILCTLGGKMFSPEGCERVSKNLKHKIRQLLRNNEVRERQKFLFAVNDFISFSFLDENGENRRTPQSRRR
jgi:hypothetical protein